MDMADHGLHKIPTQKSSGRAFATWLQPLIQNLLQNLVWAHAADSGVFWWIKFIWGDDLLIVTTGCWDFQSLPSFSGQNQCCVSTRLREVETPGPILVKSGVDSADVCLPGPRVHHYLRDSSARTQSPWPPESFLWPSPPGVKPISGKKILPGPAQGAIFNIDFLSETFATLFHVVQARLIPSVPPLSSDHLPCTMTDVLRLWMATGLGGNTCFPQARAHSHKYFVSSPQPQKPESYSYEKLTFFCQVSPSKSCSLHRAPIAAPNTLKKSTLFYPKTVGTWWFGSAGAAKQVSAVHTTPAFISLLWFCAGGYKEVVPPQCCESQLLAGDGGLNLYRHLGRQGDEAELNLLQKQSIRK